MDAVRFLKERRRMCDCYPVCSDSCPVYHLLGKYSMGCSAIIGKHTEEYVAAVEKWSKDQPIKIRASDLFEKLPKAKRNPSGVPDACAMNLGYCNTCIVYTKGKSCKECWETPMED